VALIGSTVACSLFQGAVFQKSYLARNAIWVGGRAQSNRQANGCRGLIRKRSLSRPKVLPKMQRL